MKCEKEREKRVEEDRRKQKKEKRSMKEEQEIQKVGIKGKVIRKNKMEKKVKG